MHNSSWSIIWWWLLVWKSEYFIWIIDYYFTCQLFDHLFDHLIYHLFKPLHESKIWIQGHFIWLVIDLTYSSLLFDPLFDACCDHYFTAYRTSTSKAQYCQWTCTRLSAMAGAFTLPVPATSARTHAHQPGSLVWPSHTLGPCLQRRDLLLPWIK